MSGLGLRLGLSLAARNAGGTPTPSLGALSLDDTSVPEDSAATINILGATTGSTITVQTGTLPTGMTLDSGARTIAGTPTTAATSNFTLRETLAGATNTPNDTALSIEVTATANFLVTNDAEFIVANAAATAGQIIQLQDSGTFTTLTMTNATGVTVRSQTRRVPVVRQFILDAAHGATLYQLHVQPSVAPTSALRWIDLQDSQNVTIDDCLVRCGDFLDSFADYDPTFNYSSYWGTDGAWTGYAPASGNALDWAGYGIGSTSAVSGDCTIVNCEVTDTNHGIKFSYAGGGTLKINNNELGRVYSDPCSIIMSIGGAAITALEFCGNEIYDVFSQPQDNLNPHADPFQFAGNDGGAGYLYPIPDVLIAGNLVWLTPGCRGEPQRIFMADFKAGYPMVGPVIVDNLLGSRITSKGIECAEAALSGGVWSYVRNNTIFANPVNNAPIQNELYTNPNTGVTPAATTSQAGINIVPDPAYPNAQNFAAENVTETVTATTGLITLNNISLGRGNNATSYGANANPDADAEWNALVSAQDYLTAMQTAATLGASKGVGGRTGITSAATLRSTWANPATRPLTSFPKWVDWVDLEGATISTAYGSGWAMLHIPGGGSATLTPTAGTEFAVGAVIGDTPTYGSTPATVNDKDLISLRKTSSASSATQVIAEVTIGADVFNWGITTAASTLYPAVLTDTSDRWYRTSSAWGTAGPYLSLWFRAKFPSGNPSITRGFLAPVSGVGPMNISFLTTGLMRCNFYNAAGTNTVRLDMTAGSLFDGNVHEIFIDLDTSQAVAGDGRRITVDGVGRTSAAGTYTTGDLGYARAVQYAFAGTPGFEMENFEIQGLAADITQRLDFSDSAVRNLFARANIGADGSGAFARQPEVFLTGTAGQTGGWNDAAGINWGGMANKFVIQSGGAVTDVVGSGPAWP